MEANGLAIAPLLVSASHETKLKYLEPMTRPLEGDAKPIIAAYCVTEPGAGSDVAGLKTKAVKVDGGWRLSGSKMWITNGGVLFCLISFSDDGTTDIFFGASRSLSSQELRHGSSFSPKPTWTSLLPRG